MTLPLILQIQQDLISSAGSATDALRKAKIACFKLRLMDFGKWINDELDGDMDKGIDELPVYRILYGTPEAFNPYHGWQPIGFQSSETKTNLSTAAIGLPISTIE